MQDRRATKTLLPTYTICLQKVPSQSFLTWPWVRCLCVCSVNDYRTSKLPGGCLAESCSMCGSLPFNMSFLHYRKKWSKLTLDTAGYCPVLDLYSSLPHQVEVAPPMACPKLSSTSHCHATRGNVSSYPPFRASRQAGSVLSRNTLCCCGVPYPLRYVKRCLFNSEHEQFMTLFLNAPVIS